MKKTILRKKNFAFLFFFVLLLVPFFVSAQLVPCGGEGQPECHLCHLFEMIGRILSLLLTVIVPLVATLMIMISGIMFFTASGDPGKIEKSKSIIKSVIIGLLISFLAWSAVVALYAAIGAEKPVSFSEVCELVIIEDGGGEEDIEEEDDDGGEEDIEEKEEKEKYTLTVYNDGGNRGVFVDGKECEDVKCEYIYDKGIIVSVSATDDDECRFFKRWYGACSGTNPNSCSTRMNDDKTIIAFVTRWITIDVGFTQDIPVFSMACNNSVFVAGGRNSKASWSSDGVNWNGLPEYSGPMDDDGIKFSNDSVLSISYGKDIFVAVGEKGKASWSSDGVSWNVLLPDGNYGIRFNETDANSISYGDYDGGRFVVVGNEGKASISKDGKNWNRLLPGENTGIKFGDTTARSVAYGKNKFIVVGDNGKSSYSSFYHPNQTTTWIKGGNTGINALGLAYGKDIFVAVGEKGKASWSSDGRNWNILAPGYDTGIKFGDTAARSVAYGENKFIVVGDNGKASWSYNGKDWYSFYQNDINFDDDTAYSIIYCNNRFIIAGNKDEASYSCMPSS